MALFIKHKYLLLSLLFGLVAGLPLLHPGLIPTHDGEYHLIRFYEFNKMLSLKNWYPRWAPDLYFSYGLPLFTYNYPLPNYVAAFFHLLGASSLDSVKLNMFAALIVGTLFFFLWAREFWGDLGALTSSVFYTFAPYHFVDIYVRGSVGEVWALALFPGFLWVYTKYVSRRNYSLLGLSSIFLGLTIFSHNILGLMFFVFALCYMAFLILGQREKIVLISQTLLMVCLALGMSAIFWIPALLETKYVTGLQIYDISQNFPDLFQLLFPSWGTGFFDNNLTNQMSVQIGSINLLVVGIGLFIFILNKNKKILFGFFLLWFVILFILMLRFTLPLWLHVPLMHYFQFPWRLLSLVILVCAFLAGGVVHTIKPKLTATVFIFLTVVSTYSYTQPAYYMLRNDFYYVSKSNFIDGTNSPGNSFNTIWNIPKTARPKDRILSQKGVTLVGFTMINPTDFSATFNAQKPSKQSIQLSYFPGWVARSNGIIMDTFPNSNGLLSFSLAKGVQTVRIYLQQTGIETTAMCVTLISFLAIVFLFIQSFILKKRTK